MIEWAVTSSVLILVVLALRRVLMGKISLRLQYGLWALVLVRLLLPVSLGGTAVSVLNAVERTQTQFPNPVMWYVGGETPERPVEESAPFLPLEEQREQYEQNQAQWQAELDAARAATGKPISLGTVLLGVWTAGAVCLGLWLLWVNMRFARKLCRSRRPLDVESIPLPVYVSGAAQTPCLFGLVRPCIYVTEEVAADETILRHSLAHELTHYHHKDHIWAALRGLCLALHWYNPLVWLASILSRRDGELCCDEATVKHLGEEQRAAYGRTLLDVTCQGRDNPLLTATSMTGSGNGIKERIVLLAKRPKTALYTLVAVILIAVIAVGCTFTGAQEENDEIPINPAEGITTEKGPEPITADMLSQGVYDTLTQEWEEYDQLDEEERLLSSHIPGNCYADFEDWASCEKFLGLSIPNSLEDSDWLENGTYAGMPEGFRETPRVRASWYGTREGHVEWMSVQSGYRSGELRITLDAMLYGDSPVGKPTDSGWSVELERQFYLANQTKDTPLMIENAGEQYVSLTAYLAQGYTLYRLDVIGTPDDRGELQETMEQALEHFF